MALQQMLNKNARTTVRVFQRTTKPVYNQRSLFIMFLWKPASWQWYSLVNDLYYIIIEFIKLYLISSNLSPVAIRTALPDVTESIIFFLFFFFYIPSLRYSMHSMEIPLSSFQWRTHHGVWETTINNSTLLSLFAA